MTQFKVLTPGAYTTVQDRGRFGYQQMGVPISGALDDFAFRVANLLVGNPPEAAALEITLLGPRLEMLDPADVALTGARMKLTCNGVALENWQSHRVQSGDVLEVHQVQAGCRGYLAVGGGVAVPRVMGSCSTYVGGRLGGFQGRSLAAGDVLAAGPGTLLPKVRRLAPEWIPDLPEEIVLRAIPGPQDDFFDQGLATLLGETFMVSAKADRMGYRLQGPPIELKPGMPLSIVSEPSMPGGIQIPADAQPIVLLVEQTVGGYTKIATVISVDLPRLAQATPGDRVRFARVDLAEAHVLYRAREALIGRIAASLA